MIEVRDAGFRFGKTWIYRGITASIAAGEIVAVLGPNGRGKTTLLKAVAGLLQPEEGSVRVAGEIGFVPQSADVSFDYSVLDIVVMGRTRHIKLFQVPSLKDYAISRRILETLGLADFEGRAFNQLSGGERQLVLIARALASECELLLLDEPASALDFRNQDLILRTLRSVARERNLTVFFSTHYPQHALHLADKVLLMEGVEAYKFGSKEEMLTESNLEALYGIPIRSIELRHNQVDTQTLVPIFS